MSPTDAALAARALYLSRWASKPTFVGAKARELMRRIGRELTARRVPRTTVVALVIKAKQHASANGDTKHGGNMRQTWNVDPNAYGFTLVVDHACGHEGRYLYGLDEVARRDTATQQAPKCLRCHNRDEIERLTAKIAARVNTQGGGDASSLPSGDGAPEPEKAA